MSVGCGGWVMMPQLRFSDEDLVSMSANAARKVSNPGSRGEQGSCQDSGVKAAQVGTSRRNWVAAKPALL